MKFKDKKERKVIISIFSVCFLFFLCTGCKQVVVGTNQNAKENKNDKVEPIIIEQQKSYEDNFKKLQSDLAIYKKEKRTYKELKGNIDVIYLSNFKDDEIVGQFSAQFLQKDLKMLKIEMKDKQIKQIYEYYQLDGYEYITYQTSDSNITKMPRYTNCDQLLRYSHSNSKFNSNKIDGFKIELLYQDNILYKMDCSKKEIIEVNTNLEQDLYNWIKKNISEVNQKKRTKDISLKKIKKWIPKDYSILDKNYAVGDINQDGVEDILIALYPNLDYTLIKQNLENDPDYYQNVYRHVAEYEYAEFWILFGTENGEYKAKQYTTSIEMDFLTLVRLDAYSGGFELEYFVGRSPWHNRVLKFEYNKVEENCFLDTSYFRSTGGGALATFLRTTSNNFGKISFKQYFDSKITYNDQPQEKYKREETIRLSKNKVVYSNRQFSFHSMDKEKEEAIYQLIKKEEENIIHTLDTNYKTIDSLLYITTIYQTEKMLSIGYEISGNLDKEYVGLYLMANIDLDKEKIIVIKDFISPDLVTDLLQEGEDLSNNDGKDSWENYYKTIRSKEQINLLWDTMDSLQKCSNINETAMAVGLAQEGLVFFIRSNKKENPWPYQLLVDKELLRNTQLYSYWDSLQFKD